MTDLTVATELILYLTIGITIISIINNMVSFSICFYVQNLRTIPTFIFIGMTSIFYLISSVCYIINIFSFGFDNSSLRNSIEFTKASTFSAFFSGDIGSCFLVTNTN